jgi:hypothetical protein
LLPVRCRDTFAAELPSISFEFSSMIPRTCFVTVALLAAFVLTGCGDPSAKLLGKWQLTASGGSNPLAAMAVAATTGESEFKKDGNFSLNFKTPLGERAFSGTWRFVKVEGQTLVVAMKASDVPENESRLEFTDNDHFTTIPFVAAEGLKDIKLNFARKK